MPARRSFPAFSSLPRREWPVRIERDFSFSSRAYAGDRWVVVGDAGSFLDPVFSTGVAIALESGLEGAQAIDAALRRGEVSVHAFRVFDRATAGALSCVSTVRARVLHDGVSRSVLRS